jgi:hypothetical protein
MKSSKQNSRATNKRRNVKRQKKVVVNSEMRDFSNDPYFVEKAERARELLIKYVVPKLNK